MRWMMLLVGVVIAWGTSPAQSAEPIILKNGDRIVFIGNTFVEREQRDGLIELAITLSQPKIDLVFRNLGWSGDTVEGRARRFFGKTEEGFQHLLAHVDLVQPTVIFVCYGTNEAFEGEAGRKSFETGYPKLLDELAKRTDRIVLITSPPLEPATSPAPQLAKDVNSRLAEQAAFTQTLAAERGYRVVDLFASLNDQADSMLTENGLHLTPHGYAIAAREISRELGLSADPATQVVKSWPSLDSATEALRQRILEKNALFFHRHRPENETYLRGFRKHEQGNNAVEIEAFEPLVRSKDDAVFAARRKRFSGSPAD